MGTHGTWNVVRRQFFRPAPRSLWTVVSFAPQNFPLSEVEQSVGRLKQACERLGEHLFPFRSLSLTSLLGMGKSATGLRHVLEANILKPLKSAVAELHLLPVGWREYVFLNRGTRSLI